MKTRNKKENLYQRGFTLIELLVVIAIIALLAAVVLVSVKEARDKARYVKAVGDMQQISKAANLDYLQNGNWASDGFPGQPTSFVPSVMALWPAPPCPGWAYDWDIWGPSPLTVRITLRRSTTPSTNANSIYYLCLEEGSTQCGQTYGSGGGGSDILSVSNKKITCSE